MFIRKFIDSMRQRKKEKEATAIYDEMLKAIPSMYTIPFRQDILAKQVRKLTEQELINLIDTAKSVPPSVPPEEGYYIPSLHNYVLHCLETWPESVFYFKHLEIPGLHVDENYEIPHSGIISPLPVKYINKDLFVFYYNDFGLPGTALCGRMGYVFYDIEEKRIVANHWYLIS